MSNSYNLAVDLAPVQTVVDAIRAVDVPAIIADIGTVDAAVDDISEIDVVNIRTDIAAIETVTAKERSMLGIGAFPGFRDCFNKVADAAVPDATYWNVIEDGTATVQVLHGTPPNFLELKSIAGDEDAIVHTMDKFLWAIKENVTTLHMKGRFNYKQNTGNGNWAIGFLLYSNANPDALQLIQPAQHIASLLLGTAYSSDGAVNETTDLTAFLSDNVWFDLEIEISATYVRFYIDGSLRATHEARVPDAVWQASITARRAGEAFDVELEAEQVEIWCE